MSTTKGQLAIIATTATTNGKQKKVSAATPLASDSRDGQDDRRVREDPCDTLTATRAVLSQLPAIR